MMVSFAFKCCRVCGGDIDLEVDICTLCGSRQRVEKRFGSNGLLIVLAALGFFGIMLLGIMSARAIPQFISIESKNCNAAALESVNSAKSGMEMYYSMNGRYPDTLAQIFFKPEDGVTVTLKISSDKSNVLVGLHERGDKEYLVIPGKAAIYCRDRHRQGARFVPVE